MTKFFASLAIMTTLVASVTAAQANSSYGNAIREAAKQHMLTPGGVFDGR
jgi:hypothetical protein